MTDQANIPEAIASVTYSITSKGGYNALFTIRGTSGAELLETMGTIEKVLNDKGYIPQVKQSYGKKEPKYVEGRSCPKCGKRLVDNFKSYTCENNIWDKTLRKNVGTCDFIEWKN